LSIRLTVKSRGDAGADKPQATTLDEAVVTLGRDPSCQVVLAQQAVSRNHARISKEGTLFFIEDLGSSYGTQVNREKLPKGEKRLLRSGDIIAIANFDVTFDTVSIAAEDDGASKTMFVSRRAVKDVMKGLGGGEQPYFRIMSGPTEGERIELLEASEIVFGRDPTADVVLNDDLVSRRHAKVRRDWSGAHVEDLGSRNGIKVNKKRAKKVTLKDRDEVEIGALRLLYIDPNEVREAQDLEPPSDEAESTLGLKEAHPPAPAPKAPEEPEEAKADSPENEAPAPSPEDGGEAAQAESAPDDVGAEQASAEDDGDEGGKPKRAIGDLIDLSSRQTQIALGVAGVVILLAVVIVVMLIAGA
jgi:pSer/pThr/pTyr-binding forkhead associated (FHA) protein